MAPGLGKLVLGVSGMGFPLTQLAIRRFGRQGAILTEGVCLGLAARDAALIASGAPARLRRAPALLLWFEFVAAVAATALGLRMAFDPEAFRRASGAPPHPLEMARRAATGALFGLHTWRFRIYLQADHGLKSRH